LVPPTLRWPPYFECPDAGTGGNFSIYLLKARITETNPKVSITKFKFEPPLATPLGLTLCSKLISGVLNDNFVARQKFQVWDLISTYSDHIITYLQDSRYLKSEI